MADTQQEETPQRKTPAQKAAERTKPEVIEPETTPLDLLREQAPTMGVAVLIVAVVLILFVYRSDKTAAFDAEAWQALGELKAAAPTGDAGYEDLAKKYAKSEAGPYIRMAWASRLYASGLRPKVQQAVEVYEQVLKENKDNTFLQQLIPGRVEAIKAELGSDHSALLNEASEVPNLDDADPSGMGDDADDHAGHGHGPDDDDDAAETPEAPADDAVETPEAPADAPTDGAGE